MVQAPATRKVWPSTSCTAAWTHSCTAASTHSCTAASTHSCTAAWNHSCTAAWTHSCTAAWTHSCTAASTHSCTAASTHSCTAASTHSCTTHTHTHTHTEAWLFTKHAQSLSKGAVESVHAASEQGHDYLHSKHCCMKCEHKAPYATTLLPGLYLPRLHPHLNKGLHPHHSYCL